MDQARRWRESHHLSKEPPILCTGARSSTVYRQSTTSGEEITLTDTFIGRRLMMRYRYILTSYNASDPPSVFQNGSRSPGLYVPKIPKANC